MYLYAKLHISEDRKFPKAHFIAHYLLNEK